MDNLLLRVPNKYWAYLALSFWGAACFLLLDKSTFGIDEGAARALLLVWSIVDNVVSPIVTSGLPDFRTIFLVPSGFLWTGNVLAAKVSTIFVMSGTAWAFFTWRQRSGNAESALLASGLLLISPLIIDQIDSISIAPFLLLTFALGAWLDKTYRESPLPFGGMYFAQMFLCLISSTLHPAGLAYPLGLLWAWYKSPIGKQRNYFFGGIIFSAVFALSLTLGWHHVEWLTNPISSLSNLVTGSQHGNTIGVMRWVAGIALSIILAFVIWKQAANLWADFLGRILVIALVCGILVGDDTWSLIALSICLYWGFPIVLQTPASSPAGFWGQRGMILLLIFVVATSFMLADNAHYQMVQAGNLTPRDNLIRTLVENTNDSPIEDSTQNQHAKKPLLIASQWPGLTMLACRCGAFPLPPPAKNEEALLAMLSGVDYLIFDPQDPKNVSLSRNIAVMNAGEVETVALQEGGVIVKIKKPVSAKNPK